MRRRGEVVTTSLCMFQRHRRYISNEAANYVSVVRHQDVSVVPIHNVPLLSPYDVSCKSQMKHLIMLLRYVSTMPQSYVVKTVSAFSNNFVMSSIW